MALRIGPVGPVREAGLGSGAGLGSEVRDERRRVLSSALSPSRAVGVRPPLKCLCPTPVAATHSKCGLAPRSDHQLAGAAAGVRVRVRKGGVGRVGSLAGNRGPGARRRSRSLPSVRAKAGGRRSARRRGSNRRVRAAPCWRARRSGGVKRPGAPAGTRICGGGGEKPSRRSCRELGPACLRPFRGTR